MTNKKFNRLDESFSGDSLQKAFTGNTTTSIDPSKLTVTQSGIVQSSTGTVNILKPKKNSSNKS
ncbi:MAG: hypothetical protein KA369_10005 [Spirochaetes bacterium]|jgi:hypothetical protein|nr:hypothetical protein [Spirochaetota bacterium]